MGEKIYYYQAPTGFPDRAQYWVNTGALLNRMNFGLAIASGRIPGIAVDLDALNGYHEPESTVAALNTYSRLMMPGRNLEKTTERLTPMINDPSLAQKVSRRVAQQEGKVDDPPLVKNMLAQVVGIIIGSPEYQRR
ncbi:hypothetical protein GCM10023231_01110 [Olivibacter ginsenosidimutans]|uniref:DUF1800 domain-containing protein n=2 Tax=Olivibacter ginsenosidimutans TaxID=1176537 RepID=A0ABP9AD12_9SPHI